MSRWFRHYAGMCSDPKFGGIARRARVGRDRAIFVFAFILESASEKNERGAFDWDADAVADLLNCPTDEVEAVHRELTDAGMIGGGVVENWSKRQFESDKDATATERQRRHRSRNAPVTDASRVTNAAQREDTKTDTDSSPNGEQRPSEMDFRCAVADLYTKRNYPPPETGAAVVWLARGRDPKICLAVIDDLLERKGKRLPLNYFDGAIEDAHRPPAPGRPPPPAKQSARKDGWAELFRQSNGLGEFRDERSDDVGPSGTVTPFPAIAVAGR